MAIIKFSKFILKPHPTVHAVFTLHLVPGDDTLAGHEGILEVLHGQRVLSDGCSGVAALVPGV